MTPLPLSALRLRRRRLARPGRGGFTLIEVLLALALVMMLLLAANQFIFSMGELWGENRRKRLFDQHVRAVTRYLEDMLQRAAVAPVNGRGLRVAQSDQVTATSGPLLTFELPAGDRMLPWPAAPLPDVECMLGVASGRGLLLHWQSRWEVGFETTPPRMLVLSPLVARLDYDYYQTDTQAWQTETAPLPDKNGKWTLPTRLRLHFQYDRYVADTVVRIPPPTRALPAF